MLSVLLVLKARGWLSVVPMKSVVGVVPAFPSNPHPAVGVCQDGSPLETVNTCPVVPTASRLAAPLTPPRIISPTAVIGFDKPTRSTYAPPFSEAMNLFAVESK
jgi:hypothetical protein